MKHLLFLGFALLFASQLRAQFITISDPNFQSWLTNVYPGCLNGSQLNTTCPAIQNAHVVNTGSFYIQDLNGIQYFTSLDSLYSNGGMLANIPSFPSTLTYINLSNNQLASIPSLPSGLVQLLIDNNQLTSLPLLPNTMITLDAFANQLTSVPAFPQSLKVIDLQVNQLTSLPTLPDSLISLGCGENGITWLPPLPSTLAMLECANDPLGVLPTPPPTISYLICDNTQISTLPPLPPVMYQLECANNPMLSCLPPVFTVSYLIDISNTAITCLPNVISHPGSWPQIDTLPLCGLYSNGCAVAWNVAGHTYLDANNNCANDNGEPQLHHLKAMLYHNGTLTQQMYTQWNGMYSFDTDLSGGYSISMDTAGIPFHITCPISNQYNANITALDSLDDGGDFGVMCNAGFDVGANALVHSFGAFFPGDSATVQLQAGDMSGYYGASCNTAGVSGMVQLVFNGPVMYAGSAGTLAPANVSGDTVTWNVPDFSQEDFYHAFAVKLLTNTNAQMGQQICMTVSVTSTGNDMDPTDNFLWHCFSVTNSFDPNEKEASPVATAQPGGWLTYTVHFQNTGNAPAHHVLVVDTLDTNLDLSSFQLLAQSHEATVQVVDNVVHFTFLNINLPDATSNPTGSQGWVEYRVKAKNSLALNTTINNNASIYFDFNAPVVTNATHNTYQLTGTNDPVPTSVTVYPNPANDYVNVTHASNNWKIDVRNLNGELMVAQTVRNADHILLRTDRWSNGVYVIEVTDGSRTSHAKLTVAR